LTDNRGRFPAAVSFDVYKRARVDSQAEEELSTDYADYTDEKRDPGLSLAMTAVRKVRNALSFHLSV
jgi:hypothetical protein